MNKLKILLIHDTAHLDDETEPRFRRAVHANRGDPPSLPDAWQPYFDLKWIRTPYEARWILDAVDALSEKPRELGKAGFPPEVILFDYSMMNFDERSRLSTDPTNPIPRLARKLAELRMKHPVASDPAELKKVVPMHKSLVQGSSDRIGCYMGGTFTRAFDGHPCIGMPCTIFKATDNAGKDALFFEWLSGTNHEAAYDEKLRGSVMEVLLAVSMAIFRQRVGTLLVSGRITLSIKKVHEIIDTRGQHIADSDCLDFHSLYGTNSLPLRAIFADNWIPGKPMTEMTRALIVETLKLWMTSLFKSEAGFNFYIQARFLQDQYQRYRESDAYKRRERLEKLIFKHCTDTGLSAEEKLEFKVFCRQNGWTEKEAEWPKTLLTWKNEKTSQNVPIAFPVRNDSVDHLLFNRDAKVARLAVLLMCVWVSRELLTEQANSPHPSLMPQDRDERSDTDTRYYLDYLDPLPKCALLQTSKGLVENVDSKVTSKLAGLKNELDEPIGLSLDQLFGKPSSGEKGVMPTPHEIFLMKLFAWEIGWDQVSWAPWFRKLNELYNKTN